MELYDTPVVFKLAEATLQTDIWKKAQTVNGAVFRDGKVVGGIQVKVGKATKLKKHTVNVTGVVVDGVGYGVATCKKPAATRP